jgi:hypothetical protein
VRESERRRDRGEEEEVVEYTDPPYQAQPREDRARYILMPFQEKLIESLLKKKAHFIDKMMARHQADANEEVSREAT